MAVTYDTQHRGSGVMTARLLISKCVSGASVFSLAEGTVDLCHRPEWILVVNSGGHRATTIGATHTALMHISQIPLVLLSRNLFSPV